MKLPFTGKSKLEAQLAETVSALVAEKEMSAKLASEVETLKAKIEELAKVQSAPSAELEAVKKENESLKLEVAKAVEAATDFESKVTAKAMDVVAAQGIPVVPVVHEDKTKEEILAQYNSIKNLAEQRKFYERNYAVLKSM